MNIHPTAIVSPDADVADDVEIGPFCLVEDGVRIGRGCRITSHSIIQRGTEMGSNNMLDVGVVIGGRPQHLGAGEQVGRTLIGNGNRFREYSTVHHGYLPEGTTVVGDRNMFMVASHVGHDCTVGDNNIIANNVMLGGHVDVGNQNYFGGGAAVHQFCRVGSLAMIGGLARVTRDIPPYVLVDGDNASLVGLNSIGLRRAEMPPAIRKDLKEAYRIAFRNDDAMAEKIGQLKARFPTGPVKALWQFMEGSSRGMLQDRRRTIARLDGRSETAKRDAESPSPMSSRKAA